MCGMQRVADKHNIAVRPALGPYPRKVSPDRLVVYELVSFEGVGEDCLANSSGLFFCFFRKARAQPRCTIALHDERAHCGRVAVVMCVEAAELRFDKGLS